MSLIFWVLVALGAALVAFLWGVTLWLFSLVWYEARVATPPRALNRIAFLRTILIEMILMVVCIPFGIWGARDPRGREKARPEQRSPLPVILVHGFRGNWGEFIVFRRWLRNSGWGNIFSLNYSPVEAPLETYVEQLDSRVEEVLKATGAAQVDLIGHSQGGIIVRAFVSRRPTVVRKAVLLGAPLNGTKVAGLGDGANSRQLVPGSEFLAALNASPVGNVSFLSVWGDLDEFIVPAESASLRGSGEDARIEYCGHLALVFSRRVFDRVRTFLADDPPRAGAN